MLGKEKNHPEEEDDGRTIADMNVEGMPWYREHRADIFPGKTSGSGSDLTPEQMRMYRWAAIKAGLFVAAIFGIVFFLFIFFCDFIWFR